MAQTGYTPISIYYSSTASNTPTAGNLVAGELAINTADGKLFYKDSAGVVQVIGTKGGVGTSSTTQVLYNSSGLVVGSANLTFNGTTLTTANDASISGLTVGKGGGSNSTAVGYQAGNAGSSNYATMIGYQAGYSNTATSDGNVMVGWKAGYANTSGTITAVGQTALTANTTGAGNSAFGSNSLPANTTGSNNTGLGNFALYSNTTASNNTAVGYQAGYSNTTGEIQAFGRLALYSNTTAVNNSAFGNSALYANTTGASNTAVGYQALTQNTTASNNTAVGYQAGYTQTTGIYSVAMGFQALYSNTTGSYNVAIGRGSLFTTTGSENTAVGQFSLNLATTGINNTAIGTGSGSAITTGSKNTIIGGYSGNQGGLDIRGANNRIVLSDGDGNPRAYWDNFGSCYIYQAYNDTTASAANMFITSGGQLTRATSALKYKQDIRDLESVDINKFRAVRYKSKCDADDQTLDHFGVIADEVDQAGIKELVSYGADGEVEGFQYERLTVVLLKAVQELKAEVDSLKQQLGK